MALQLLARGDCVAGIDNLNDYYDVALKRSRLERLSAHTQYQNFEFCISDMTALTEVFRQFKPPKGYSFGSPSQCPLFTGKPDPTWSSGSPNPSTSNAPCRIYNIGNNQPVELLRFIELIESNLGRKSEKILLPMQPGDVPDTYADVDALMRDVGYKPDTPIEVGIERFVEWHQAYYNP